METRIAFKDPNKFFNDICSASGYSLEQLAELSEVTSRTIRSWRAGDTSMPASIAQAWSEEFNIPLPVHESFDLSEKRRAAGMLGGHARIQLYGNFGTAVGRRKGGLRSIGTHRSIEGSPFVAQNILFPERGVQFAELIGIALGDGGLTKYQFIIYLHIAEKEYIEYVRRLIFEIFDFKPSVTHNPSKNVTRIICSRKNLVSFLQLEGLSIGNKTRNQAIVPAWVQQRPEYARACIRGLVDTDGCVYFDIHTIKGKKYKSCCIAFTSASAPLLDFVENQLKEDGYTPTRSGRDVRLRRKKDVERYSREIGFSNPKHLKKIEV
ncbi:MAG TPA: LAGLIDADG family homing endonuclease [Candidatus Paceibacterota bacterium]